VHPDMALVKRLWDWGFWEMRLSAMWGPTREMVKTASRKTWGPGLEKRRRRWSTVALPVGSMVARTVMASGGSERGGWSEVWETCRVYDAEESGGIVEKGLLMEKRDGFVVVRDTATDMVCIRFVSLKEELHFWPFKNITSTSFASAFTSLSIFNLVD